MVLKMDLTVGELQHIGVPCWLANIAGELGTDVALTVWRFLSDASGEDHRVSVPRWSTFMRYQRNRFVISLDEQGLDAKAIHVQVRTTLSEELSLLHVKRIINRRRAADD